MNVILCWWLWEGAWGEPPRGIPWENLLCRRTGATPQFKACEIMLNLMLNLGYDDFESS